MLPFRPHKRPPHQPTACLSTTARDVTLVLDEGGTRQARDARTRRIDCGGVESHRAPAAKLQWALRLGPAVRRHPSILDEPHMLRQTGPRTSSKGLGTRLSGRVFW